MTKPLAAALAAILLSPGGTTAATRDASGDERADAKASRFIDAPYPSTYVPAPAQAVLISGATVLTGTGERLEGADVLLRDGRIEAVGRGLDDSGAVRVDEIGRASCRESAWGAE